MRLVRAPLLALVALVMSACATVGPPSADSLRTTADQAASALATEWGVSPGTPRESKLRSWVIALYADPNAQAAASARPWNVDAEAWARAMTKEGLLLLPDDATRTYFEAKDRLLREASDSECRAFASSVIGNGTFSNTMAWRERLARASEADFEAINKTEIAAFAERAKRRAEPVPTLSERDSAAAARAFEAAVRTRFSRAQLDEAMRAMDKSSQDPSSVSAEEICIVARMFASAAAAATGRDARLVRMLVLGMTAK